MLSIKIKNSKRDFFRTSTPGMLENNPRKFWQTINPINVLPITLSGTIDEPLSDVNSAIALNHASSIFTWEQIFRENFGETPDSIISEPMPPIEISANGIVEK